MKKKGLLLVVLLLVLTIVVLYFGYDYSNKQQEKLVSATSRTTETAKTTEKEDTTEVIDLATYEEKRDSLSVLDYLKYIEIVGGETAIALYGQLPEEGTWTDKALNTLDEQLTSDLQSISLVKSETDSYELFITNTAQELVETNAAVVFFMMPSLGDQVRDVSLEDSASYLERNVTSIKDVLPNSLVVMVTPSPSSSGMDDYNSRMLDYVRYMERGVEEATENNWPLFDIHASYMERLEEEGVELTSTLQEDGSSLNSQGEEWMAELFMEQLTLPIDTTSGVE